MSCEGAGRTILPSFLHANRQTGILAGMVSPVSYHTGTGYPNATAGGSLQHWRNVRIVSCPTKVSLDWLHTLKSPLADALCRSICITVQCEYLYVIPRTDICRISARWCHPCSRSHEIVVAQWFKAIACNNNREGEDKILQQHRLIH